MYDDYIVIIVPRRRLTVEEIHQRYKPNYFGELYMRNIEKRLSRLEGKHLPDAAIVEQWIATGRFYDDLSDEEKGMYCSYKLIDREVFEEVEEAVTGTLHLLLEKNKRTKLTKAEKNRIIQEIEAMVEDSMDEE